MGGKASGYECPKCGSLGPHNIQRFDWQRGFTYARLLGIVLSCHSCEHVWQETY